MPPIVLTVIRNGCDSEPFALIVHTEGARFIASGDWYTPRPDLGHCALQLDALNNLDRATLVFECPQGIDAFEFSIFSTWNAQREDYEVKFSPANVRPFSFWAVGTNTIASGPTEHTGSRIPTRKFSTNVASELIRTPVVERHTNSEFSV